MVTKTVREFASRFKIDPHNPHSVIPVIREIKHLKPEIVSVRDLDALYAKRTAEDILHSGRVVMLSKEDRQRAKNVLGCVDNAIALVAVLRAHGIKADFARIGNSSIVLFKMAGREWSVNPARYARRSVPTEVTPADLRGHETLRRMGLFARGKDAWHIGMKSLKDYDRYSKADRKGNF